jgi:hypothetical protein
MAMTVLSLKQGRLVCKVKRARMVVMVPQGQPDQLERKEPGVLLDRKESKEWKDQ